MTLMFSLLKVFLDARLKYYASPIGVIINSIWIDSQDCIRHFRDERKTGAS